MPDAADEAAIRAAVRARVAAMGYGEAPTSGPRPPGAPGWIDAAFGVLLGGTATGMCFWDEGRLWGFLGFMPVESWVWSIALQVFGVLFAMVAAVSALEFPTRRRGQPA